MMESEVMGNYHASFGERDRETRTVQAVKVRPVPTPFSPVLMNMTGRLFGRKGTVALMLP
jgi:hypothetical protein